VINNDMTQETVLPQNSSTIEGSHELMMPSIRSDEDNYKNKVVSNKQRRALKYNSPDIPSQDIEE